MKCNAIRTQGRKKKKIIIKARCIVSAVPLFFFFYLSNENVNKIGIIIINQVE